MASPYPIAPAGLVLDATLKAKRDLVEAAGHSPRPISAIALKRSGASACRSDLFFDIYEDTPEQNMTNLLQHSTCTLDISGEKEREQRCAEGHDKDNIPLADDASQSAARPPTAYWPRSYAVRSSKGNLVHTPVVLQLNISARTMPTGAGGMMPSRRS